MLAYMCVCVSVCFCSHNCRLEAVNSWQLPDKVSGIALSTLGGAADGLVAVSSLSVSLRLADIRSGAFTHTLVGHRWGMCMQVTYTHWSVTGGGCACN